MLTPMLYRLLGGLAFIAAVFFARLITGHEHIQDKWDTAKTKAKVKVAETKVQHTEATIKVVTEYLDRAQIQPAALSAGTTLPPPRWYCSLHRRQDGCRRL